MRSSPFLLLLITTQCCFFSSNCAADGVTYESVDSVFPTPSDEELLNLSKEGLKLEMNKAGERLETETAKKNQTEKELETKRQEFNRANQSFIEAEKKWIEANDDWEEKRKPLASLAEEVHRAYKDLEAKKRLLTEAENKITFPPEIKDKRKYALDSTKNANRSLRRDELKNEVSQLTTALDNASHNRMKNWEAFNSSLSELDRLNCVIPEDLNKRSKRGDDECSLAIDSVIVDKERLETANKTLSKANTALSQAKEELKRLENTDRLLVFLEALDNRDNASSVYEEVKRREKIEKDDSSLADAGKIEKATYRAMNKANESVSLIEKEVSRLEGDLSLSILAVSNAEKVHAKYLSEYKKRPEQKKEDVPTSSPSISMIGGAIGGGIAIIIIVLAIIFFIRCKKRRQNCRSPTVSSEPSDRVSEDARILGQTGRMTLDVKAFKYGNVIQFQSYDGDLPHDKENEDVSLLPKTYTFVKDRMKFFFYGLDEDKPKATETKGTTEQDITRYFFQPHIFEKATEKDLVDMMQKEKIPLPQDFADKVRAKREENKLLPELKLDPALMRIEFLRYLHAMASKSYIDEFETYLRATKFKIDIFHVMWILSNAKQVLIENHKSQMLQFDGSIVIVGDIHGHFPDLLRLFGQRATMEKPGWLTHNYLFLGDYVDKGNYSLEVVLFLFMLKILYPKHIMLLRGNHEELGLNRNAFLYECNYRYDSAFNPPDNVPFDARKAIFTGPGKMIFQKFNEVFEYLPISALINKNIFCAHGGIGKQLVEKSSPQKKLTEHFDEIPMPLSYVIEDDGIFAANLAAETMWNDPNPDSKGFTENKKRKCFFRFGITEYREFKRLHGISLVFRGHEMRPNGFEFPFDGTLITTFSAPRFTTSTTDYVNRAATFDIDLKGRIGCHIAGRDPEITKKDAAMSWFRKKHVICSALKFFPEDDDSVRGS